MATFDTFLRDFPSEYGWLQHNAERNAFAYSLLVQVKTKGSLSDRQLECVRKNVASVMAKASAAKAATIAPVVSQDKLMLAFDTAKANKLTRLKIRFDGFFCYPASETSANAGAIYVKNDNREYMGKVQNGRFVASRDCSPAMQAAIARVLSDPLAEAIAYGKQTGNCAICGRFLENKESVERGIGPICAAKYGFI